MESVVILLIASAIALLIVALLLMSGIAKYQQAAARAYDIRTRADAAYAESIMRGRHADSTRWGTFIVTGPGDDDWTFEPSDGGGKVDAPSLEANDSHKWAVEIVSASIRDLGGSSNKLLPGNKWSSAEQWQAAVNYLKSLGLVITTNSGTIVKAGTIQDVMTKLAVSSLPRRIGSA